MSNSRSPTPTPQRLPTSTTSELSTLRSHPHEHTSLYSSGGRHQLTTTTHSDSPSHPSSSNPRATDVTHSPSLRRPAEHSSTRPLAKRMRREQSEERADEGAEGNSQSSPSVSSQGGFADNETEGERSQQSELSANVAPPPKKKRTRTLTTPHQSAVLHALLAQSRFPTTAMREEVGRSIGLSARKVQIWFQNQRQKARRPRSQSATPLTRPPQFGPFPNVPPAMPAQMGSSSSTAIDQNLHPGGHYASGSAGMDQAYSSHLQGSTEDQGYDQFAYRAPLPAGSSYPRPTESSSQLLGPGMPGPVLAAQSSLYSGRRTSSMQLPPGPSHFASSEQNAPVYRQIYPRYSESPPVLDTAPHGGHGGGFHERTSSRTLPPLVLEHQHSQIRTFPSSSGGSYPSSSQPASSTFSSSDYSHRSMLSPLGEPPFTHHMPEQRSHASSSSLVLPPPMVMQPQPRWDASSYALRPNSGAAWSGPGHLTFYRASSESSGAIPHYEHFAADRPRGRLVHPFSTTSEPIPTRETLMPRADSPPRRSRRFDPVRASQLEDTGPSSSSSTQNRMDDNDLSND